MTDAKQIKKIVKDKYGQIARQADEEQICSCGCSCEAEESGTFSERYDELTGYIPEADLGLGCGLPTKFAAIKSGDTVVDLGSGAGNDAFVARSLVGVTGKVIGVDMTQEMVDKAKRNNEKMGFNNVEFLLGDIEGLPLEPNTADVVISNCVLNLVPDKKKAFKEIFRILKPGAHFCISDIVLKGGLPQRLKELAEMYAGCVAGALQQDEYIKVIQRAGFSDVAVKASKEIVLPDEVLKNYLTDDEITSWRKSGAKIISITVVGYKKRKIS